MPSIADLEKLLAAAPNDAFLLYGLAHEHAKAGRHADSMTFFDRCLAADPNYCYAYYHKARVQLAAGLEADARRTIADGVAVSRRVPDMHAVSELQALLDSLDE
jgi:tetratricopeptide (TPR) repeat protein